MKITKAIRKEIAPFLPKKYRHIIVERLGEKGITVHPNTVSNVLKLGNDNPVVAAELVALALEYKRVEIKTVNTMQQVSQKSAA